MNKYDIYLADVPFQETDETKLRPILILNDAAFLVSIFPITSKGKTAQTHYKIIEWREAGLDRESYISLEPKKMTDKSMIRKKIGQLQAIDIFKLEMLLSRRI